MNILWSNVFQVGLIDLGAHLYVVSHTWRCSDIVEFETWIGFQFRVIVGFACHPPPGRSLALVVHLAHSLNHLEQSRTSSDAISFERRRNSQADGFLRPAYICYHEIGGQRVKPSVHTLH